MMDDWAISAVGKHFPSDLSLHSLVKLSRAEVLPYNENRWTVTFAKELGGLDLEVEGLVSETLVEEDLPSNLHGLVLSWQNQGEFWQARLASRLPECVKIIGASPNKANGENVDEAQESLVEWLGVLLRRGYRVFAVERVWDAEQECQLMSSISPLGDGDTSDVTGTTALIAARKPSVSQTIEATLNMALVAEKKEQAQLKKYRDLQKFCDSQTEALYALQSASGTKPTGV